MNHIVQRQPRRRGVSILEVLFAIMITAIGLMGAIAVFPAALLQIKRGQRADATAAAGMTGHHAFDAMGMRRPDRWMAYNGSTYATVAPPDGSIAYCIDPRFIAANQTDNSASTFPYGSSFSLMQRVTLNNGANGSTTPMSPILSELHFRIEDDLSFHRFTGQLNNIDVDRTNHSESIFSRNASSTALKRESDGHMSWMATLSPKIEQMTTGGAFEDRYLLSVVIFYDRPAQLQSSGGYAPNDWELTVPNMYGGGIGGGDMRLQSSAGAADEQLRQVTIHRDQWVMLTNIRNPSPPATPGQRLVPICHWYRVIDSDEPVGNAVDVTLAGADWEVPAIQTRAIVAQGAVAVFEKTIKLEPRN